MNLLISTSPCSTEVATAIEEITHEGTKICGEVTRAATVARGAEYAVVIVDQASAPPDPAFADDIFRNAGLAVPVLVNSALMNVRRIGMEVTAALARVERERRLAARKAEALLRRDLKDEITGILIAAEVALQAPDVPVFVEEKLHDIEQLATRMRGRFETVQ